MSEPDKPRKKRFWVVDPSMFRQEGERSKVERIRDLVVSLGRRAFILLLFSYPLLLIYVGLAYGGVAFWGLFAGSFAAMGLFLWKLGYAKNFDSSNPRLGKQLLGLILGFVAVMGFYEGLFHLGVWILPITAAAGIALLFILFSRG